MRPPEATGFGCLEVEPPTFSLVVRLGHFPGRLIFGTRRDHFSYFTISPYLYPAFTVSALENHHFGKHCLRLCDFGSQGKRQSSFARLFRAVGRRLDMLYLNDST